MRREEIRQLKQAGYSADRVYMMGAGNLGLFTVAFFGHRSSASERQKLNRLWKRICKEFQNKDHGSTIRIVSSASCGLSKN